jgi:hypothetical protein
MFIDNPSNFYLINTILFNDYLEFEMFYDCFAVDCIRAQRAFSIQMPDQYVFCHLAFLE